MMRGPAIGEQFTELSSEIFTYSKTDLSLPGPMNQCYPGIPPKI